MVSQSSISKPVNLPSGPLYEGQKYGIGFAQGNEELVKKVNGVLDQMRKDGSYAKLYEKWFGFAPKESDM